MNNRLETFCDGVFAIAITLLILEIKIPPLEEMHSTTDLWRALGKLWPSFFALSFSFVIIFITWAGHHSLLRMLDKSSPHFLFANGFFLFTIILMPFPTAFMAEYLNTPYAQPAIFVYCLYALLPNLAWNLLHYTTVKPKPLVKHNIEVSYVQRIGKGAQYGFFIYAGLALLAWWLPYIAITLSALTWIYWLYLTVTAKQVH